MRLATIIFGVCCFAAGAFGADSRVAIYDADPQHLWNRLHAALLVRDGIKPGDIVGVDSVDPILWSNTKHLLDGESHTRLIDVLDEFLSTRAEKLIQDPLKRALLQRDLWAVFDWACDDGQSSKTFPAERAALQGRLSKAIRRVALTREQIDALPNTYAAAVALARFPTQPSAQQPGAPFLPPDLLDPDGDWLNLYRPGEGIAAPLHVRSFGGRSIFNTFLRHPGGREAGIEYLEQLSSFPQPYVSEPDPSNRAGRHQLVLNPALPQVPVGTQVALLRRAMLIDTDGQLAPTNLVETLQLRVYLNIPEPGAEKPQDQSFHEFRFTRRDLLANPGRALRAVAADEQEILHVQFASHGIDRIEEPRTSRSPRKLEYPVLSSCFSCHSGPGIFSLNTFTRHFGPQAHRPSIGESSSMSQFTQIESFKRERFDWGLFHGLTAPREPHPD